MQKQTTVDQAIKKGKQMIFIPIYILMLGGLVLPFVILLCMENSIIWLFLLSFLSIIIAPWVYWSFAITYWRLWAFEKVQNVHELYHRAVEERLIWQIDHWAERTEIRTKKQQLKWSELYNKFKYEDKFSDDLSIPKETKIYFSIKSAIIEFTFYLLLAILFVLYTCASKSAMHLVLGLILSSVFLFGLYDSYKKIRNRKPQIILNDKGIETAKVEFCSWGNIQDEQVKIQRTAIYSSNMFSYFYNYNKFELINTSPLDVSIEKLRLMLSVYRWRYENKTMKKQPLKESN
jgi:hypothetical protein